LKLKSQKINDILRLFKYLALILLTYSKKCGFR